jgi:CBS domain-containing protein
MRIQDVMTTNVKTIVPTASAADAWETMRSQGIHHLVVKRGPDIVGVLSDRDVGGRAGVSVRAGRTVADLMNAPVATIDRGATIRRAANVMRGRSIGCLPVTYQGRLAGIVTLSDLLTVLGGGVDRPRLPERNHPHYRVAHRHRNRSAGAW